MHDLGKKISPEHDHSHYPANGDGDSFQESWAFAWYDPISRFGGWHRFGMQRPRKIVDINSFLSRDGVVIGRYENSAFPLPDGDFTDLTVGPISIRSEAALTKHAIKINHGGVQVSIVMEAFVGPFGMAHRDADAHWESFGRVRGTALIDDGNPISIAGMAFQDRSWGARDFTSILSFRIATAIFDENLIFRIFQMTRREGHSDYGFVIDNGQMLEIAGMDFDLAVATDGISMKSVDVTMWTKNGRGYHLTGRRAASDLCVLRDGIFSSHAQTVYECGGRLGVGCLDFSSLRSPTPLHLAQGGRF